MEPPKQKPGQLTAWDMEPPVSTMFDARMASVLGNLRRGNINPLLQEIEHGRLEYVSRFMTPEDNTRLARALRTGSPLTQSEKRKTRHPEKRRDMRILARICYWKAKGLPVFSQTSQDTAIHRAVTEYGERPGQGAPAGTPESFYRHVWRVITKSSTSLSSDHTRELLLSFIDGLAESLPSKKDATARFVWFGQNFLSGSELGLLWKAKIQDLDSLIDSKDPKCESYRQKIALVNQATTHALSNSGHK